jgi:hypothetical protein
MVQSFLYLYLTPSTPLKGFKPVTTATRLSFCMFVFSLPLEVRITPRSVVAQIMKKFLASSDDCSVKPKSFRVTGSSKWCATHFFYFSWRHDIEILKPCAICFNYDTVHRLVLTTGLDALGKVKILAVVWSRTMVHLIAYALYFLNHPDCLAWLSNGTLILQNMKRGVCHPSDRHVSAVIITT